MWVLSVGRLRISGNCPVKVITCGFFWGEKASQVSDHIELAPKLLLRQQPVPLAIDADQPSVLLFFCTRQGSRGMKLDDGISSFGFGTESGTDKLTVKPNRGAALGALHKTPVFQEWCGRMWLFFFCCNCRVLNLVSTRSGVFRFPVPLLLPWCSMWVTVGQQFSVEEITVFQACLMVIHSQVVCFENHEEWRFCLAQFRCVASGRRSSALLAQWRPSALLLPSFVLALCRARAHFCGCSS